VMLSRFACFAVVLTCLALSSSGISGEYTNNQAADRVLGQSDFTSALTGGVNQFQGPGGIAIDPVSGKVFVADTFNHRVLRFPASAATTSSVEPEAFLGQSGISGLSQTAMSQPRGICFDPAGRLWVVDQNNSRVLRFDNAANLADGAPASAVLGQINFNSNAVSSSSSGMSFPFSVTIDPNGTTLYVSDFLLHRVLRFDNAASKSNGGAADFVFGQSAFNVGTSGLDSFRMNGPRHLDVDSAGRLWVADSGNHRVLRFDNAATRNVASPVAEQVLGQTDFTSGNSGTSATQLQGPDGIAVDAAGNLFVSEANQRVTIFLAAATKSVTGAAADRVLGQPNFTSTSNGVSAIKFSGLNALTTDAAGRLFVVDGGNNRVLRFSPLFAPPSVTLKGSARRKVVGTRVKLTGTASAEAGLAKVEFSLNKAPFVSAVGTTSWKLTGKPLKPGRNSLTIRATDSDGGLSGLVKVRVTRL
jgi:sugar lactone lactonase YvrE